MDIKLSSMNNEYKRLATASENIWFFGKKKLNVQTCEYKHLEVAVNHDSRGAFQQETLIH